MSHKKGFTLLEILLVVGIISILAGIVIIAINPNRQLAAARNAERKSDIKQLYSAMTQFYIDEGYYPASSSLSTTLTEVCDTGDVASTSLNVDGGACDTLINLSYDLVPKYLVAIPKDPQGPLALLQKIIPTVYAAVGGTAYYVAEDATDKLILTSERAENGVVIAIGTTTGSSGEQQAATYTVTFDSNDGSAVEAISGIEFAMTIGSLPTPPTKEGYTFSQWTMEDDGSGGSFTGSTPVSENITVHAQWVVEDPCSIANAGTCSGPDDCYTNDTLKTAGIAVLNGQLLRWSKNSTCGYNDTHTYGHWYKDGQSTVHLVDNLSSSYVKTSIVYFDTLGNTDGQATNGLYYKRFAGPYSLSSHFGISTNSQLKNAENCNWVNAHMNNTNVCATAGMRLPTFRETQYDYNQYGLLSTDSCDYNGAPAFSGATNGVPSNGYNWTASSYIMMSDFYFEMIGTIYSMGSNTSSYPITCVAP